MTKTLKKIIFGTMPETALEARRRILAKATKTKPEWHKGKEFEQNKVTVLDKR